MFSEKNSTFHQQHPSMKVQYNPEHNEFNSHSSPSLEDKRSYYYQYNNITKNNEPNNWLYDYYSQSSQSIDLKAYVGKPLLFSGRTTLMSALVPLPKEKNINTNCIGHFNDTHLRNATPNFAAEADIVRNFEELLKECTQDVKGTMVNVQSDLLSESKANMEIMLSNFKEIIEQIQENIKNINISEGDNSQDRNNYWGEVQFQRSKEMTAVKDEIINEIQNQMNLVSSCKPVCQRENSILDQQNSELKKLLLHCCASIDSVKEICSKHVVHSTVLEQLLMQNKNISQDLSAIALSQTTANLALSAMKSSLTALSQHVNENCKAIIKSVDTTKIPNTVRRQNITTYHRQKTVCKQITLPISLDKTVHEHSLLPNYTWWFDANGMPSPVAVVPPVICRKDREGKPNKVLPSFYISSDSDSGHEISEIIGKVVCDLPSKRYRKSKTDESLSDIKGTPDLVKGNGLKSTPLQRSIRRYGQIKKFVNPFSPSPMKTISIAMSHNVKGTKNNTVKHVKKVSTDSLSAKKITGNNRSARSAVMEKRNLEINNNLDEGDMKKLANIQSSHAWPLDPVTESH